MAEKRNTYTDKFKKDVVAESQNASVKEVAEKHGLKPGQLSIWRKRYGAVKPAPPKPAQKSVSTDSNTGDLYKKIGELVMEIEWLKQKCG